MRIKTWVFILNFGFCLIRISAQHYPFTTIGLKEGLPQGSVSKIIQDYQGYIWLATSGGVCRYDGVEFKTFTYGIGLEASDITDIEIDDNGRLWISTYGKGIAFFDGDEFLSFNSSNGFPFNNIKDILFSSSGDLWISTLDKGLVRAYMKNGIRFELFPALPVKFGTKRLIELPNGNIIVFGSGGYVEFDKSKNYSPIMNLSSNYLFCGLPDQKGGFWAGGRNVLYYKSKDSVINRSDWLLPASDVRDFLLVENTLFIATTTGVLKVNGNKVEHLAVENGVINSFTTNLYNDLFGNIWVGGKDGVTILDDHGMVHYDSDEEKGNLLCFTMAEDKDSNVWVGRALKGYYRCSDTGIVKLPVKFSYPFFPLQTYSDFSGQMVLLVNFKTIYKVTQDNILWTYDIPDTILRTNAILPLFDSTVIVGTTSGVFKVNNNKRLVWIDEIGGNEFVNFFIGDQKDVWVTSANGRIFRIRNDKATEFTDAINPSHDIIKHGLFDSFHHVIWLCTEKGLIAWDGLNTYRINTSNGLKSNLIYAITQDSIGRIWAGHVRGVECIDMENMKISYYGYNQGFLPIETNARAAITDSKGNVWFGTVNSATKILVNELGKDTVTGMLRMQKIYINEQEMYTETFADSVLPGLTLKHDENNLVFKVASLCYTNAKDVVYTWKMEGYDKHWNQKTNHREIVYPNLEPGTYKLRVYAENPDGYRTNEIVLSIYIAKPFWQTAIFYITEILVFILIIFLSFRFSKKSSDNRFGQIMTLLTILIIFESIMLYISRYTDQYTSGIPIFQLLMNVILAASLYPLERKIKRLLEKGNQKK